MTARPLGAAERTLMPFPAAAASPTEQARTATMLLAHYRCPVDDVRWGRYFPIQLAGA